MKAYLLKKSGKAEVLELKDIDIPKISGNQVLIKIEAIGINYAEILSRQGKYSWAPARPYVPGMEAYGEVVEIGKDVSGVKVGDKVIAGGQYGMYAEYGVVPQHLVFPAFSDFTPQENAAILVNFMTAWVALVKLGRIRKGDNVLIQAAAGGVGTAAVQIAVGFGADVTGTAGSDFKLDIIRKFGAKNAINYRKNDFLEVLKSMDKEMDIVLELVGGEVFHDSVKSLSPFGRVVVAGYASIPFQKWNPFSWYSTWKNAPRIPVMDMARSSVGLLATHIGYLTQNPTVARGQWEELQSFITAKSLRPHVGHTMGFEELIEAHKLMESRQSVGKIVLTV